MRRSCLAALVLMLACEAASAYYTEDFESFTPPILYGKVMFRCPGLSASTSAKLAYYYPATLGSEVGPDGNDTGNNIIFIGWQWVSDPGVGTWLRLTTHMADYRACPALPLDGQLSFRVLYEGTDPLGVSVGLRETGTAAADGAFGGSSGPIEWVGATGGNGSVGPTGLTHILYPSNQWQKLTFDFKTEPVAAFTGDGVLNGRRGAFEHIAFSRMGSAGLYTLLIDDVTIVPEPSSALVLVTLCAATAARRTRRLTKPWMPHSRQT